MSATDYDAIYGDGTVLARRIRVLTVGRLVALLLVTPIIILRGHDLVEASGAQLLVGATAAYLVLNVTLLLVRRSSRGVLRWSLEIASLADVLTIAILLAVTGGLVSPFAPLMHAQVVAITLVLGLSAGVRSAALLSLAAVWLMSSGPIALADVAAQAASQQPVLGTSLTPGLRAAFAVSSIWLVVLLVSQLSRMTEADMRRWLDDLELLRDVSRELGPRTGISSICDSLARTVVWSGGFQDAVVWLRGDGANLAPTGVATRTQAAEPIPDEWHLAGSSELVARSATDQFPKLIKRSEPRPDGLLRAHGPRAPLVVVPLHVEDALLGVISATVPTPALRAPCLRGHDLRRLRMLAKEAALLLDNARLHAELESLAVTDALTGLPNHGFFQQRLSEEVARAQRHAAGRESRPLSVVMIDLDHFKVINDTYGHPAGDTVLTALGETLATALRVQDVACRYGGEEFGVILADTTADGAIRVCERIREAIARLEITIGNGRILEVTASFGVATDMGGGLDRADLIAAADQALYAAKHAGRDRIMHADALHGDEEVVLAASTAPLASDAPRR